MLQKVATFSSDSWSSWWWLNSEVDNALKPSILSLAFLLLATAWFLWICFKKSKKEGPTLPPGPPGLPLVGNLMSLTPQFHTNLTSLARTYGPIFTLWLGNKLTIVLTSSAIAREIKDNDVIFSNRNVSVVAKQPAYGVDDVFWSPYGSTWQILRKVLVHQMLSNPTMDSFQVIRTREIRKTIGFLYSLVGSPVKISDQMFLIMLNLITSMLWGGIIKGENRASLRVERITELLGTPNVSDFYPSLAKFDLQGLVKKMKDTTKRLDGIFDSVIDQRLKMNGKESKDFLQFLLEMKDERDAKTPLTMNHIKALFMDVVVGGTDTTINTIEFAMAELINKPQMMQKLQLELDTVVGKNSIVEESHIPKLPYLHAVMKEILRLHPPLPLLVPRSPSQTCTIGGYTIPKGSQVLINAWAIHRDPSIWENPSEFDPERFLNGKRNYSTGNDFNYIPFGFGRRICAGIAMVERLFMFSLASIVHSFEWKLPQGEKLDLSEMSGIVLKKKIPLVAIPTPRLSDRALYE